VHPWINGDIKGLKKYLSRDWWAHFDGRYVLPNHWLRPPLARASSNRSRHDALERRARLRPVFMKKNISTSTISATRSCRVDSVGKLAAIPTANRRSPLRPPSTNIFSTSSSRSMTVTSHSRRRA
jgi:hypothetical protein